MEGPLSKWTNVVKGWQYRWFVLDDNTGLLSYYTVRTVLLSVSVNLRTYARKCGVKYSVPLRKFQFRGKYVSLHVIDK